MTLHLRGIGRYWPETVQGTRKVLLEADKYLLLERIIVYSQSMGME